MRIIRAVVSLTLSALLGAVAFGALWVIIFNVKAVSSPYPASPVITGFSIDLASYNQLGHGDNWPTTWAADGEQYSIFADGSGFNGGTEQTFGWAKVTGAPGDAGAWSGSEPASNGNIEAGYGSGGRKASGLIQVDGTLYASVRNLSGQNGSSLRRSLDNGLNWEWASWPWPEFGYPFFVNMGQNYAANSDGFVYLYSPTSSNAYAVTDGLWLARVPKVQVWTQAAWQYFSGFDSSGIPTWSSSIAARQAVFSFPGHVYRPSAVYNTGLDRYLISMSLRTSEGLAPMDALYVFDAPTPWGPWTTVYENENFSAMWAGGQDEDPFHPQFPPKWISTDGKTMYLAWSCYPCTGFYAFNVAKVSLTASTTTGNKQGDADCNGVINVLDALMVLRYITGTNSGSCLAFLSNVDCTDGINVIDALKVLQFLSGLPVNQDEPCPDIGQPV